MNRKSVAGMLAALCMSLSVTQANADILFQDDFESGDFTSDSSNQWSWREAPGSTDISNAMMRGENDVYSVSNQRAYRGSFAMRMDFAGRNSFCNLCGATTSTLNSTTASTGCFSADIDGPYGDSIFNVTNGFTRWEVTSVNGRQICVNLDSPQGGSVIPGRSPAFSSGDDVRVPRRCGVNGTVAGGQPGRRSDCNRAINYLRGVDASDMDYGASISRRFYMFIPSQTALPGITLKLGYSGWRREGESVRNSTLKMSVQRGRRIILTTPDSDSVLMDETVPLNTWVYFEETFTRESGPGRRDAQYRLYMGDANAPSNRLTTPILVRDSFELGRLMNMSIHGNWQHNNAVSGDVFFDDIVIATEFVGPVGFDPDSPPPEAISDLN